MNRKGQATVELALGIMIFIPVLLLGIHFAEVGALTLRVNQAAAAAIWDTTGMRMHRFDTGANFYNSNAMVDGQSRSPQMRANQLYRNFDGLASGGTGTITQTFTQGSALTVTCAPSKLMKTPVAPGGRDFGPLLSTYKFARANNTNVDGMSCSATGTVSAVNMPTQYLEKSGANGFFSKAIVSRATFSVCAIGRPNAAGNCKGELRVALDDWALSGHGRSGDDYGDELQNCGPLCLATSSPTGQGSGNQAYVKTVQRVFDAYKVKYNEDPDIIHDEIVTLFTTNPSVPKLKNVPVNTTDFRLAFVGEEGDLGEATPKAFKLPTHEGDATGVVDWHWETTPGAAPSAGEAKDAYRKAYLKRGECFLGSDCGKSPFDKSSW